jgi:transcriptional regulator with XRE-family HTH domain
MNRRLAKGYRIAEFRSDRDLLEYTDTHIARRMGIDKGNYSKYINGHQPITQYFLSLFYQAFGDELSDIKLATGARNPTIEERFDELARRLDYLQQVCDRIVEDYNKK